YTVEEISLAYDPALGLEQAIRNVVKQAEDAARAGKLLLFISERMPPQGQLVIHALLATAAIHHHLSVTGLRCDTNLVVETGSARDPHQIACLIGYGATAVYPYLAHDVIDRMINTGMIRMGTLEAHKNYRKGINKGLMKIMSKMGISTISSYRGAQLFEIVGLSDEVTQL